MNNNDTYFIRNAIRIMKALLWVLIFFMGVSQQMYAQEDVSEELLEQLRNMSLEDIINMEVSITSQTPLSMRDAPGIVTLITREDIINTGARDLIDVLTLLVPGFSFGQSEFGPIGIGVRGIWANDGKLLLLVDGIEVNEDGLTSVIFGNHFLTENIERIEVIRGPGSVVYGGYAGLGVINVITKDADDLDKMYAGFQLSRMFEAYSHRNASFGIGGSIDEFKYSITGYMGQGKLSDREFVNFFRERHGSDQRQSTSEAQHIEFNPMHLNVKASYKNLSFQSIFEKYNQKIGINVDFLSSLNQLKYEHTFSDNVKLTTSLDMKFQIPWKMKTSGVILLNGRYLDTLYSNDKTLGKITGKASLNWDVKNNLHFLGGIEVYRSSIDINYHKGYYELPFAGLDYLDPDSLNDYEDDYAYSNYTAYAQLFYKTDISNVTVGGRYEYTESFGSSFVPRIAFTKTLGDFHVKAMYSHSYRIPGGRYYGSGVKPERGIIWEFETGYHFGKSHFLVANIFHILYDDIIGIDNDADPTTESNFTNLEEISTKGLELEYRLMTKKFNLGLNGAYFNVCNNSNPTFAVPGQDDQVLAFPQLRFNAYAGFNVSEELVISPSLSFFGKRYGYIGSDTSLETAIGGFVPILKEFSPTFIFNVNFHTQDLFAEDFQLDLGIRNLLNTNFEYIQPHFGIQAPVPAPTAAIVLRAVYEF